MRSFSKSRLIAYRQCEKRLWLEFHRPDLREHSVDTQAKLRTGHRVGEIAQRLYDPRGRGVFIDLARDGYGAAFAQTAELLELARPVFEAGFSAGGAYAFADVMLPTRSRGQKAWRMVEVKSSTTVKEYHRDDVAVQAFAARRAGVPLVAVALAYIDSAWVYPGGEDYRGLLIEQDMTSDAFSRESEVRQWIRAAREIVAKVEEPGIRMGNHCNNPYPCGFTAYCKSLGPQTEYPVSWLPGRRKAALDQLTADESVIDMREIPDELLTQRQRRVKQHTLSGEIFFDSAGAAQALSGHKLPAYFLDFETIQFAVPIWKGTRPYQQIPFQFSVHRLGRSGKLERRGFLDVSGNDPSKAFAEHLIVACGERGPVFVYNAAFENSRIQELAERYPRLRPRLLAIKARVVDLLPVAQTHFYHPQQQGSWSIKKVLPAVAPELRYDALGGVQDGGMAMEAYLEAIASGTAIARKKQIQEQLTDYCGLDTYAMVRLWQFFVGRHELKLSGK